MSPTEKDTGRPAISAPVRGLLACGIVGFAGFTGGYLALGARRTGYDAWRDTISVLSEGPRGWAQDLNFAVWGGLNVAYALGLRLVLDQRSVAGRWVPRLAGLSACGLVILGAEGAPSGNQPAHIAATTLSYVAWPAATLLLVPRFARDPRWRGWATYSVLSAVVMWTLGYAAGRTLGTAPSGLLERLSVSVIGLWCAAFAARLLLGTPPPRTGRPGPAGRARRRPRARGARHGG